MKKLLRYILIPSVLFVSATQAINANDKHSAKPEGPAIEGRWDITIDFAGKKLPSWLEVRHSGSHRLIGSYVGPGGSARPVSKVNFTDGKMSFTIPPQWEKEDNDIVFEAMLQGDSLVGTVVPADGKTYNWIGHRAPLLKRTKEPVWGSPIVLFNGKDLKGWHTDGEKENQWKVENGILHSPHAGSNIMSDRTFNDFKLHIEFRYPKESNSGVYLRGRYEVQIADSKGMEPSLDQLGAVYGFIKPLEMAAKGPGEWQSYDITLVGRIVSITANGKQIVYKQEIPGSTGGALDSNEGEPGPIMMQGDHGSIEYRNIVITPAK
ncbi:MAG: DUF1080 domain-containing protein [Bacteroidota bacterium]